MENRIEMLKARVARAMERLDRCETTEDYLADLQIIVVSAEELSRLTKKKEAA